MPNKPSKKRLLFLLLLLFIPFFTFLLLWLTPAGNIFENLRFEKYINERFRREACSSAINLHYTLSDPSLAAIDDYEVSFGTVAVPDPQKQQTARQEEEAALNEFNENALNTQNRITLDILRRNLEDQKLLDSCCMLQEVLGPSLGTQAQLPILLAEYTFRTPQDITDYLKLLNDLPRYFQEILAFEQEKARQGVFMNNACVDGIIEQCASFINDSEPHYLQTVFEEKLADFEDLSQEERTACLEAHKNLMQTCVLPAYQQLSDGLAALRGTGTNPAGLAGFENGTDYYRYLLRSQVGTDASPEEIEQRLYRQLNQDSKEVSEIAARDPALLLSLSSPELNFSSPETMLEDLEIAITEDFPALDDVTWEIKTVDEAMEEFLSPAFYLTPPADTNAPNSIYINNSADMSSLELYTTLAHEGFPGHLYQTVCFSLTDAPYIRHLYTTGGYIEGWATYVESYAYSYAVRNNPEQADAARLMWLNRSINLCLYSLMDIGIHYHGWNQAQTEHFLSAFGVTDTALADEIFQYIVETPANYLKYYLGYLNFEDLKQEMQQIQQEDFSLKDFHKQLLEIGPAPFPVVRKYLFSGL